MDIPLDPSLCIGWGTRCHLEKKLQDRMPQVQLLLAPHISALGVTALADPGRDIRTSARQGRDSPEDVYPDLLAHRLALELTQRLKGRWRRFELRLHY